MALLSVITSPTSSLNTVMIELKATESITDAPIAQALNYLTTTKLPLCLILNFGEERVEVKHVRL